MVQDLVQSRDKVTFYYKDKKYERIIYYNKNGKAFYKFQKQIVELKKAKNIKGGARITNNEQFSCFLLSNSYIYEFMSYILFVLIKKGKECKFGDFDRIMKSVIYDQKQYSELQSPTVMKNAFDCDCTDLVNKDIFDEFLIEMKKHKYSFMQIAGAAYDFKTDEAYILSIVKNTPDLKQKVLEYVQELFSTPDNFTYEDLLKLKQPWFIPWIISYMSPVKNLFHRNLTSDDQLNVYIRSWKVNKPGQQGLNIKEEQPNSCRYEQLPNIKKLIKGNSFFDIPENGIFIKLMTKYNKEYLAGPSSSSSLMYQIVFNITRILEDTLTNKVALLLCIIADYYPNHHTITEILLQYSKDANFPVKYSIDMNDLEYIYGLIEKCDNKLKSQFF